MFNQRPRARQPGDVVAVWAVPRGDRCGTGQRLRNLEDRCSYHV